MKMDLRAQKRTSKLEFKKVKIICRQHGKLLEIARVIFEKTPGRGIELSDVHQYLGDLSMESGTNYYAKIVN